MLLSFYFDLIPIALACYVLIKISMLPCKSPIILLSALLAIVFIICQSAWIFSYIQGFELVVSSLDLLWTVFNGLVMILILLIIKEKS